MMMSDEIHASFWTHLEELRAVLIRSLSAVVLGLITTLYFQENILNILMPEQSLFLFSPAEGFIAIFKLSFWLGLLGTSPYWVGGIIRFIRPALRGKGKVDLPGFFLLSLFFITCGLAFCKWMTLPLAIDYLFTFNQTVGTNLWGFSAYLDFLLMLFLAHGVAFELGAIMFFLVHKGLLHWSELAKKRRHNVVASLILGALLTPPDVLTQVLVAVPLVGFYELAILYGRLLHPDMNKVIPVVFIEHKTPSSY